jgi:hypothetical protein
MVPPPEPDDGPSTLRSIEPPPGGAEICAVPPPAPVPVETTLREPSSAEIVPLQTTDAVLLTPARAAIAAGGTLEIAAAAPALGALTWSIFPKDAGSIAPNKGDGARATYTAPVSVAEPTVVMVMAYDVDGRVGIGMARVTVEPPTAR